MNQAAFHCFFITPSDRDERVSDPDLVPFNIIDPVNGDDKGFMNPDEISGRKFAKDPGDCAMNDERFLRTEDFQVISCCFNDKDFRQQYFIKLFI